MRTTHITIRRQLLAGIALFALGTPAFAQEEQSSEEGQGNEIIVTATKRGTTLQDVPFSINAQTADDIRRAGSNSIEDIARNVAGLTVQNLGPGQSQVSVRGVSAGQIVRDQPGVKEQVGIYVDESVISLSLFTPDLDLFDLNRVETLRGPQGTLFGSGSVGGTIRYITNQPELGVTEGAIEANLNLVDGDDIGGHLKGAINLPLGESAALRAVGYYTRYGGFINAIGPVAGEDVNDGERYGGRLALTFESGGFRITPRVIYQKVEANGFNRAERYNFYFNPLISPTNIFPENTQYLKIREQFTDETLIADLTASIEFGGSVELTSVTSYIDRDILVSRDASALTGSVGVSFTGLGVNGAVAGLTSNLLDTTQLKQWTQELRLSSTGDGPFQWVIGGFYSSVDRLYSQRLPTPGYDTPFGLQALNGLCTLAGLFCQSPGVPMTPTQAANGFPLNSPYNADLPYDIEQKAAFAEVSYDFGRLKLTAGGRYYDFNEERDFISGGVFSNRDTRLADRTQSDGFSPRFIATFEPSDNVSVNLQASKGFRLGGVNDPLNIPLCDGGAAGIDARTFGNRPTYGDETLWNYEAGIKASGAGITFNASAFYNDIRNLQVTADAGSCSSRVVFNVPKAHTMGLEFELAMSPVEGLDLTFAGSLIESKLDSSVLAVDGSVIAGIRKGNRLPTVPDFQMAATATYTAEISENADWSITAIFQHVGDRFTQPGDQEAGVGSFANSLFFNPANGTFGSGSFNFGSYRLDAYNLVNLSTGVRWDNGLDIRIYVNNLFNETPQLSLDRERGGRARLGHNVGAPRTIGITVGKTF